jgi:hypothetical protein
MPEAFSSTLVATEGFWQEGPSPTGEWNFEGWDPGINKGHLKFKIIVRKEDPKSQPFFSTVNQRQRKNRPMVKHVLGGLVFCELNYRTGFYGFGNGETVGGFHR